MERCPLDPWLAKKCHAPLTQLPQALHHAQEARLRATLSYAKKNSPFYGQSLQAISAEEVNLSSLCTLPFTTAKELENWQQFLCTSHDTIERMVTLESSGTRAKPKRLAFSAQDIAATKDFFQVGMGQMVKAGHKVLVLWPGASRPHGVSALLRQALKEIDVEVIAGDAVPTPASLLRELEETQAHALVAAPRQLQVLVDALSSISSCTHARIALRTVLSSAEVLPSALYTELSQKYTLQVLDHYGLTETGYGGGVQCMAHDGYHMRELDLLVEIVDMRSSLPLPPGQEGEVIVTTLCREAMPLIRYRTGDVASLLPGPCLCGSPLRRLSPIRGRIVCHGQDIRIEQVPKGSFARQASIHM